MFFKKKPKYLTITTLDESCAIINLREILFVKKHNFKNNIFGIEFTFKKGNALRVKQENITERNRAFEKVQNILIKNL
jgi:hypothetical protein